jgi:hypothetical protein
MALHNPISESQIPQPIARDSELTAAINAHIGEQNPHPAIQFTTGELLSTTGSAQWLTNPSSSSRVGWGISDGNPFLQQIAGL